MTETNLGDIFDENYFKRYYKNYAAQNPKYKLCALINCIKKYKSAGKLLDVGCALGAFLNVAKNQGYSAQGCDVADFTVKHCSAYFDVKKCSITNLAYADSSFDVITVFDVIEHIQETALAFEELRRVAKKDGLIVFAVPVYDGVAGRIVRVIDKDPTHINKWSRFEWLSILHENFRVLEWQGILRYFFFGFFYLHYQTNWFRKFTPAIIVVCQNKK